MLSREDAEMIVKDVYSRRAKDDDNTKSFANTIRSMINDALSGDKYIGELLQNADDAKSPAVQFNFFDNYLIFKHQGQHFSEPDFRAICDSASPDRAKVRESDQIGNKGIGFKAVFSMASVVTIISRNLCFRFDENYEGWQGRSQDYPWQIIPILTNPAELPESVREYCDSESVHFVFLLRPEIISEIQKHLSSLATNHFLFLRSVKAVSYKVQQDSGEPKETRFSLAKPERKCVDLKVKDDFTIEKVKVNDKVAWWIYKKECVISSDVAKKIRESDSVPTKYKTWKTMPISIAIRESEGKLIAFRRAPQVFCYLPTGLDFGFNFLCNAELLLETSRMQLRSGPVADAWNEFILKSIVEEHVLFLNILSRRAGFGRDIFTILTNKFLISEKFKVVCDKTFQEIIRKVQLVMTMPGNLIDTIERVRVDIHGFIQAFGTDDLKKGYAHPEINNKDLVLALGAKPFDVADIIAMITQPWFIAKIKDPEVNRQFIVFLAKLCEKVAEVDRKKLEGTFSNNAFILNNKKELKKPGEIHFPDDTLKYATRDFSFVTTVHPVLASIAEKGWLVARGVQILTLDHVITMANKAEKELVNFTLCLVAYSDSFDEAVWKKLKNLKVIVNTDKAVSAGEAYLLDSLNPTDRLGVNFQSNNNFLLHSDYCEASKSEDFEAIKSFFKKIGVSTKITTKNLSQIIAAANQYSSNDQLIQLTLIIFRKFIHGQDIAENILKIMKTLKVVCSNDKILPATQCYLADYYDPEEKIQSFVPELSCVSEQYCQDGVDASELKEFFLELGVHETIKVVVYSEYSALHRNELIKKDSSAAQYFQYLDDNIEGLCAYRTRSYMDQHYLTGGYVQISFVTSLVTTSLFWQYLRKHWDSFSDKTGQVTYETARNSKAIPSNIHYLVELTIKKRYGDDKSIKDFFGHEVKRILGCYIEDFPIADITEGLNFSQLRVLGFKVDLTLEQCIDFLNRIAADNQYLKDLEKIIFIYDNLLRMSKAAETPESLTGLSLPNRQNQYSPADSLYHIVGDYLPDSENPRLIRKPSKFTLEDFVVICKLMQVKLIRFAELEPAYTANELKSMLNDYITERLESIIAAVAHKQDWAGEDRKVKSARLLREIQEKQARLKCFCAEQFSINYSNFLQEPCDIWIDRENTRVFHVPVNSLDHQGQQTLYEFLFSYFDLACDIKEFISIMTTPVEKLKSKFLNKVGDCDLATLQAVVDADAMQTDVVDVPQDLVRTGARPKRSVTQLEAEAQESEGSIEEHSQKSLVEPLSEVHVSETSVFRDDYSGVVVAPSGWSSRSFAVSISRESTNVTQPCEKKLRMTEPAATARQGGFFSERFTKEQRERMGWEGEQAVYNFLKEKHSRKHGAERITEDGNSYTITFVNGDTKKVTWLNKQGELYQHYDFEIEVIRGGLRKLRHLEVKTTTSSSAEIDVTYSTSEWQKMESDCQDSIKSHRLFVVKANVKNGEYQVLPKKDLMKEVQEQRVKVTEMKKLTFAV